MSGVSVHTEVCTDTAIAIVGEHPTVVCVRVGSRNQNLAHLSSVGRMWSDLACAEDPHTQDFS